MALEQDRMQNPFGMDESCTNCPTLSETRTRVVHGYGDIAADFLFVLAAPSRRTDRTGDPLHTKGDACGLFDVLGALDLLGEGDDRTLRNAFITHLTRCRHPGRPPTDDEVETCESFLHAEIRSINPEILIPIGTRALRALAAEFTTHDPHALDVRESHAVALRGRGFELLPLIEPATLSRARFEEFTTAMGETMDRDYRQTKGRQGR